MKIQALNTLLWLINDPELTLYDTFSFMHGFWLIYDYFDSRFKCLDNNLFSF